MTEQLHFRFSLSCVGEGNGNPLQCSCLEHPRDGGAWWAVIYGVAQSRTRLKRLTAAAVTAKLRITELERHLLSQLLYYVTLNRLVPRFKFYETPGMQHYLRG